MWGKALTVGAVAGLVTGLVTVGAAQAAAPRCEGPVTGESTRTTTAKGVTTATEGAPRRDTVVWTVNRIDGVRISLICGEGTDAGVSDVGAPSDLYEDTVDAIRDTEDAPGAEEDTKRGRRSARFDVAVITTQVS